MTPEDGQKTSSDGLRALVVDIDGTLSDNNRVLCPSALDTLRRLKVPVILATGNTHCFTRTCSIILGTPRIFIAENGGVLSHSEDDMEILADQEICEAAFKELNQFFSLKRFSSFSYRFTDIALERNFDVEEASRYLIQNGSQVELIDTGFAVHIKDKSVNKGIGLSRIASRMGLRTKHFAAIGDSNSDIPMFELAGFRASVANAGIKLKQISDYVASAKYGRGFSEIIDYLIEKKML